MIDSISFKNFRRFEDLPKLKLGDITILVGANNTGKSTIAKALDFITLGVKNLHYPARGFFSVPKIELPIIPIGKLGNYGRIHHNNNESPIQVSFTLGTENNVNKSRFSIRIKFSDANEGDTELNITEINIIDKELFIEYHIDSNNLIINFVDYKDKSIITSDSLNDIEVIGKFHSQKGLYGQSLDSYIRFLKESIKELGLEEYENGIFNIYSHILTVNQSHRASQLGDEKNQNNSHKSIEFGVNMESDLYPYYSKSTLISLLEISFLYNDFFKDENKDLWQKAYELKKEIEDRLKESISDLEKIISNLKHLQLPIHSLDKVPVYTPSHPLYSLIKQFMSRENKNAIGKLEDGQAIGGRRVLQSYGSLLKEYIDFFGIAKDYKINLIAGEVYTFEILDKNDKWVHISDIGTGALRLIEIILFILNSDNSASLFIEEPEQNLHPLLQSRLADFFVKVNHGLGHKIIVETHSEYLVRRSQVLWAEMNLKDEGKVENPFKVYYFPQEGLPYEMNYLPSGRFENSFGKGFFDEASASALALSRLERRNKNDWN